MQDEWWRLEVEPDLQLHLDLIDGHSVGLRHWDVPGRWGPVR